MKLSTMSANGMEQTGKFLAHLILDISIPLAFAGGYRDIQI